MLRNASTERALGICLLIGLGLWGNTRCRTLGQEQVAPLPGKITFIRLRSPHEPDLVEQLNLVSGEIERVLQASPERPSIRSFRYSLDRGRFLFEMGSGRNWYENNEIYLGNTGGDGVLRLTNNKMYDGDPAWSLDGKRIAFTRGWGVNGCVRLLELGSRQEHCLSTPGLVIARQPNWLEEGLLLVVGFDVEKSKGLAELDLGKHSMRWLLKERVDYLSLSPDRKRLACVVQKRSAARSPEEPDWLYSVHILVLASKRLECLGAQQGVFERDIYPLWSPDGRKLAWIRNDRKNGSCRLLIHDVATGNVRTIPLPDEEGADAGSLVWSPDGSRLACVTRDRKRTKYNLQAILLPAGRIKELFSTETQIQCLYWD